MRPLILITNDDGIYSPGLVAAAEAVSSLGDLLIVTNPEQQSATSHAVNKNPLFGIIDRQQVIINGKDHEAYSVTGTPALAVAHAVLEITKRKPDLCVSGINYGENIGASLSCSGTIGAALEASALGIPSIAASLEYTERMVSSNEFAEIEWDIAKYFVHLFAEKVLNEGLPKEVGLLNVNIPVSADKSTDYKVTSQSSQSYWEWVKPGSRDFSKPSRIGVQKVVKTETLEPNSDIHAFVIDRVVSVTPLVQDLTTKIDLATLQL